jgi:hypothetical protein
MSTFKPYRNTQNDMTFEKADRMAANKHKNLVEFFSACKERLFYYGKEDEAFYFEMLRDYVKDGGELDPKNAARALGL